MYKKIKKIIFSMLTAYGLSIVNAGMDDGHSILTDAQSAAVQVVYQKYLSSDEKQKVLDDIVEGIIYISNIYNYIGTGLDNEQKLKSFLESVRSKDYNEIHKILTENPDLNIGFFGFSQLTESVEKYRKHRHSLLDEDRTVLSQSARKTLYNNK